MSSKQAALRERSTHTLLAVFDANGTILAKQFRELFYEDPNAEEARQHSETQLKVLRSRLDKSCKNMLEADRQHAVTISDDPLHRKSRDDAHQHLVKVMRNIGSALSARYSKSFSKTIVPSALSKFKMHEILSQGRTLLEKLRQADTWKVPNEPAQTLHVAQFSVELALEKLQAGVDALEANLSQMAREKRDAESSMVKRNRAFDSHDELFYFSARLAEMLFSLAGEPELAERVRPSIRRQGLTESIARSVAQEDEDLP